MGAQAIMKSIVKARSTHTCSAAEDACGQHNGTCRGMDTQKNVQNWPKTSEREDKRKAEENCKSTKTVRTGQQRSCSDAQRPPSASWRR